MEHHDDKPTQSLTTDMDDRHKSCRSRRTVRNVLACAAVAAMAGVGIAVPGHTSLAQPATTPTQAARNADAVQQIVDMVNAERTGAGCAAVTLDNRAQQAAQAHADDMAARDYYDHTSPEGADAGDRLDAAGYSWRKWGENIHKGPSGAEQAMRDWMASGGHRANILDCGFTNVGVGVNTSANGPWWVQVFAS
ncbi:uncharacterized protein YkwD [Saccharothrix tamanrassetensis]|uniref:Uncharacterized protein YkwD n=1 Tax=Saccharothrix tamanrassetensis TaxID=1051531 RepID=A0A841CT09_9PSEU|nr:CAP domain-containing protein [Saccharothrix tamanrassetensis]MBB5960410.1 uncharacterized protein YkwD [Saccharothrix tamanrassetensis]